jgi:hypothetical protein
MIFKAIHLKKPMLSSTIDIIMVDNMVKDAPLIISNIFKTSIQGTMPATNTVKAPIVVGIVSLIPNGLHNMRIIVNVKIIDIKTICELSIYLRRLVFGWCNFYGIRSGLILRFYKKRIEDSPNYRKKQNHHSMSSFQLALNGILRL